MIKIKSNFVLSLAGALTGLILTVAPVLLMRRGLSHFWDHWQEIALYASCLAGGAIAGATGFNLTAGDVEVKRQRAMVWGSCVVYVLYIACAVLCRRIHFGALDTWWWRLSGLLLFWLGSGIRLWAVATLGRFHSGFVTIQPEHTLIRSGLYKWLRHPSYLGALIALAGIPMIFASWFPLLAMPGFIVCIRWRINDEEKMLAEQFPEEFETYKRETWRMIPHVY